MEGVKYIDDEIQIELVRKDMRTRSIKSIKSMIDTFEKGGLKTCVAIAKEELRIRQEDFLEMLQDNLEIDMDSRSDMEGNSWLQTTIYWRPESYGERTAISSSSVNLPLD